MKCGTCGSSPHKREKGDVQLRERAVGLKSPQLVLVHDVGLGPAPNEVRVAPSQHHACAAADVHGVVRQEVRCQYLVQPGSKAWKSAEDGTKTLCCTQHSDCDAHLT